MKKLFSLFMLLVFIIALSQNSVGKSVPQDEDNPSTTPKIIPPSPTAYSLGNYGNVPVGLFTGSSNITIPLMNFKTNNVTLPITLFYGSNGLKVDEVSSNVGLGWILNYGGIITRTVRDEPDDMHDADFMPQNVVGGIKNTVALQFYQNAGNSSSYDSEMDIYSFNFNGNSGKFFYDKDHIPHLFNQADIKIENFIDSSNTRPTFLLTLSNGEKYYFGKSEKTTYRSAMAGFTVPRSSYTSWYLTKMVYPSGEEIYFEYDPSYLPPYVSSQSQTLRMTYPYMQIVGNGYLFSEWPHLTEPQNNMMQVFGQRIKKITSNNPLNGSVGFTYYDDPNDVDVEGNFKIKSIILADKNSNKIESVTFNYLNTQNKRNFLNSLSFNDSEKSYTFSYNDPESFPPRLDKGQDYWGYYNGKMNTHLVPKDIPDDFYGLSEYEYDGADKSPNEHFSKIGLLKKIIYPTKGYTDILYEGNEYLGTKVIPPALNTYHMSIKTGPHQHASSSKIIPVEYDHWMKITGRSFFNTENTGCIEDLGNNVSSLLVTDQNNEVQPLWVKSSLDFTYAQSDQFNSDESVYYIAAKAGNSYTVKIWTYRACTSAICDIFYREGATTTFSGNIPTGGVRVKSTSDFSSNSETPVYKRYKYSLGDKGSDPIYADKVIQTVNYDGINAIANFLIISSDSSISMSSNSSCYYGSVSISNGGDNFDNGGEIKKYKISRDYPGNSVWGENFHNAPWANFGWDNGLELESTIYKKDLFSGNLEKVQNVSNSYIQEDNKKFEMNNYAFRVRYEIPQNQSVTKICTQADIDRVYKHKVCTTDHNHVWWIGNGTCIANNANNVIQIYRDACYPHYVGYTMTYPYMLNNLDIMEYKNISYRSYMNSRTVRDYLNGVPVQTTTEYFYNNPSHYQLTSQETIFPDNSSQTTNYSYAHEKPNQKLIDANIVGIPLIVETTKTSNGITKTISKTETIYPDQNNYPTTQAGNLLLPLSVKSYDLQNNSTSNTKVTYDKYDDKGNLLQYTTNSVIPVTIIWGYNQTQPIAKIEGATYAQVSSLATAIIDASNDDANDTAVGNPKETVLLTALDTFRTNAALAGYQITTYSYDPLIGVRSITPPSGIREVYIYDSANRLKEVRDVNGNILKSYEYHYKP